MLRPLKKPGRVICANCKEWTTMKDDEDRAKIGYCVHCFRLWKRKQELKRAHGFFIRGPITKPGE